MRRLLGLGICLPLIGFAAQSNPLAEYHLGKVHLGMAIVQFKQVVKSPRGNLLACHRDHKKVLCQFLSKTGSVAQSPILGSIPAKTSYHFVGNEQDGILQSIHSSFSLSQYDNVKAALIRDCQLLT